jgi:hypothetical protein
MKTVKICFVFFFNFMQSSTDFISSTYFSGIKRKEQIERKDKSADGLNLAVDRPPVGHKACGLGLGHRRPQRAGQGTRSRRTEAMARPAGS